MSNQKPVGEKVEVREEPGASISSFLKQAASWSTNQHVFRNESFKLAHR